MGGSTETGLTRQRNCDGGVEGFLERGFLFGRCVLLWDFYARAARDSPASPMCFFLSILRSGFVAGAFSSSSTQNDIREIN